jgi:hypothetical protein
MNEVYCDFFITAKIEEEILKSKGNYSSVLLNSNNRSVSLMNLALLYAQNLSDKPYTDSDFLNLHKIIHMICLPHFSRTNYDMTRTTIANQAITNLKKNNNKITTVVADYLAVYVE